MITPYFMGIDGGGSTLRITITNDTLEVIASYQSTTANPNIIGHDIAQQHIQSGIQSILSQSNIKASNITAVGIGIAGASNQHSEDWLIDTIQPVLPHSLLVPSSDLEIALVGGLGQRHGILVLSGTGSAVFGYSPTGNTLQIGGWGYLLGDEGSGYWIGLQALKRLIQDAEEHYAEFIHFEPSSLNKKLLDYLNLDKPRDLIRWLYRTSDPPVQKIAPLTRLIMSEADADNWDAINLIQQAAIQLASRVELISRRLNFPDAPITFGGGLLDNDNRLSQELTERLDLPLRPIAQYSPVIGGALLAQLEWKAKQPS